MKENKALKTISYIVLPIFIAVIIISILYTFAKDSYVKRMDSYFETTSFTSDYMTLLSKLTRRTIYIDDNYSFIEDNGTKIYYIDIDNYNYDTRLKDNYVLIIYGNKAITNVNIQGINTIEDIKKTIEEMERRKSEYCKRKSRNNIFNTET